MVLTEEDIDNILVEPDFEFSDSETDVSNADPDYVNVNTTYVSGNNVFYMTQLFFNSHRIIYIII